MERVQSEQRVDTRVVRGQRPVSMGTHAEQLLLPQRCCPVLLFHLLPEKEKLVVDVSKSSA